MENNNLENVVTSQPFEPVSIKVVNIAPQGLLCQSKTEEIVDGLQLYEASGTF